MTTRLLKACVICGRPSNGPRCPNHPRPVARRNIRLRRQVAQSASVCPSCGQAPTASNPMTADHRVAQAHGGQDRADNLRPMCRSCNSRLGAAITNAA